MRECITRNRFLTYSILRLYFTIRPVIWGYFRPSNYIAWSPQNIIRGVQSNPGGQSNPSLRVVHMLLFWTDASACDRSVQADIGVTDRLTEFNVTPDT